MLTHTLLLWCTETIDQENSSFPSDKTLLFCYRDRKHLHKVLLGNILQSIAIGKCLFISCKCSAFCVCQRHCQCRCLEEPCICLLSLKILLTQLLHLTFCSCLMKFLQGFCLKSFSQRSKFTADLFLVFPLIILTLGQKGRSFKSQLCSRSQPQVTKQHS